MRVAIIGAGLAGLSCAHELERYGVKPVIYERNSFIGEAYPHVGAALEVVMRPIKNPITYLKKRFGIDIKPLQTVNCIIHHSPNKTTEIKGNLGYFLERSRGIRDIKVQIYNKLKKTTVIFDTYADYRLLSEEYDYVIAANGDKSIADELGCWTEWLSTYIRGAIVLGDFNPNTIIMWINKDYCKNGYAYLTPFSSKKASLHLVVTDIDRSEIDPYWELFLRMENIKFPITEVFDVNHRSGYVYPHKLGNVYLTGNAGGLLEPFLGFGVAASIISGVLAARSIKRKKDYEELLNKIIEKNIQLHEFRKAYNDLDNSSYDFLVKAIGLPVIRRIIYFSPLNIVKYGSYMLKLSRNKD